MYIRMYVCMGLTYPFSVAVLHVSWRIVFRNESVTETMYKGIGTGSDVTGGSGPVGGSKVDRVCDAMLTELAAQGEDK